MIVCASLEEFLTSFDLNREFSAKSRWIVHLTNRRRRSTCAVVVLRIARTLLFVNCMSWWVRPVSQCKSLGLKPSKMHPGLNPVVDLELPERS